MSDGLEDDGDKQDYFYGLKQDKMSPEQHTLRVMFLDGVPAEARLYRKDGYETVEGRLNGTTFIYPCDIRGFVALYISPVEFGTHTYQLILGTEQVLGEVFRRTH